MKEFWNKNKVFILGLLSAIAVAITPFVQDADQSDAVKWSTVGFAVLMAILAYLAKSWRGQGLSILGIVGNIAGVATTLLTQGTQVNSKTFYLQLILQTFLAILAAAAPDPKSRGYEQTDTIKDAKREGEAIQPASLTAKPKE